MIPPLALEIEQLTQTYTSKKGEVTAIQSISFHVLPGEFVVIVGPSGCGKSTILSLVAGILSPTEGDILIYGNKIKGPSKQTGYMLQKDGLLDWRTVQQNIFLGLEIRNELTLEKKKKALQLLEIVGLGDVMNQYPSQLSGGMRQRVALVRTLAVEPDILLLDEPFSALDIQNRLTLEDLIIQLLQESRKTAVLVTHDLEEAIAMGDRILVMGGTPGTIHNIIDVPEGIRNLSPMKARGHMAFRPLFEQLWREVQSL